MWLQSHPHRENGSYQPRRRPRHLDLQGVLQIVFVERVVGHFVEVAAGLKGDEVGCCALHFNKEIGLGELAHHSLVVFDVQVPVERGTLEVELPLAQTGCYPIEGVYIRLLIALMPAHVLGREWVAVALGLARKDLLE